jgi:NNP family nitrate/nitrite transporter-like MFS transporter
VNSFKGTPRQALFGATLGFFIGFAAVALFGPTASRFQELMGLSPMQVGFLVAMPALSGSLLRIPFSAWVDTTGGRRPFVVLLGLSTTGMVGLSLVVHLFYPDRLHQGLYPLLLALGVLSGCGIAVFSVGISQVCYWFPRPRQGRALAVFAGVGNLAPGIFSFLLPVALVSWGLLGSYMAWLLLLVAGTGAYALVGRNAWYFQLRERGTAPEEARRIAAAQGQEFFPSGGIREGLVLSARNWKTWALVCMYFSTFGGFVALTAWLPTYWTSYFGLTTVAAGALTGVYSVLTSGIRILGGMLSDELREGGENTAILALFIMLFGAVLMTGTERFQVAVPGMLLMAVGMGICNAAVFRIVPQEVPDAVGGAAGWIGGLGAFGGFVIPPIMGFAVRREGELGYSLGFITFVVLALLSLSLVWVLKYSRPVPAMQTSQIPADGEVSGYGVFIDASRCWEQAENGPPCDLCVRACPEVFEQPHPNAPARVRRGIEPGVHLSKVREAVRRCPGKSILLIERAAADP